MTYATDALGEVLKEIPRRRRAATLCGGLDATLARGAGDQLRRRLGLDATPSGFTVGPSFLRETEKLKKKLIDDPTNKALRAKIEWREDFVKKVEHGQDAFDVALAAIPDRRRGVRDAGARIVYNKLLGGWYVVTGPHQTPLNGRFDSKEEAQVWLDRRRGDMARDATIKCDKCGGTGYVRGSADRLDAALSAIPDRRGTRDTVIAKITKVSRSGGSVTIEWEDEKGKTGTTVGAENNAHMQALIARAKREGASVS